MRGFLALAVAWLIAALVMFTAGRSEGATLYDPIGTLCDNVTGTGVCANQLVVQSAVLYVEVDIVAGTGTVQIQQTFPGASAFYLTQSFSADTLTALHSGSLAGGTYRANVTVCTGCTIAVRYEWVRP